MSYDDPDLDDLEASLIVKEEDMISDLVAIPIANLFDFNEQNKTDVQLDDELSKNQCQNDNPMQLASEELPQNPLRDQVG